MTSQFKEAFNHQTPAKDLQTDNLECIPTDASAMQQGDFSDSPIAQLNFSPRNNGYRAKKELQRLWKMFTSWLQPEKNSKEQMISQLVLNQFLLTGHCKDKFALMEKWKSNGTDMRRFMESLTDECLQSPVMVHVSMQGQEALFSENMSLKEVIKHLKEQQSATRPRSEHARLPVDITQDILMDTGQENSENTWNTSWNSAEDHVGDSSNGNEMNSLPIIKKEQSPGQEEGHVSFQFPLGARRANQGNSSHHVEFLNSPTTADVPTKAKLMNSSRTNISEDRKDCYNTSSNATQVNSGDIPRNQRDNIFTNQRMNYPEPAVGDVSDGVPQDSTRASQGTSTCLQESLGVSFSEEDPREVPVFLSRPEQPTSESVLLCPNYEANSPSESQERFHGDPKTYRCEECPRSFKYACNLSSHQKIHLKKRAFVCDTCQKNFKRVSDLRIHEVIHKPEKPFICSTCKRSFSHKTNLKAHERIHTGEKPYDCSLCNRSFRQSSTYHRHMRNFHKSD